MKKLFFSLAIAALLLGVTAAPSPACPNCKTAIMTDLQGNPRSAEENHDYSRGINYSIFFLIGSLYTVLGGVSLLLWRAYRNYEPGMVPGHSGAGILPAMAAETAAPPATDS